MIIKKEDWLKIVNESDRIKHDTANSITILREIVRKINVSSYTVHKDLVDKLSGVISILEKD